VLLHPEKIVVVEGKFHADSYIQHLLSANTVDVAIRNDADFSAITGEACLQLSDFMIAISKSNVAVKVI
jgi:hypothetical protein